jgi:hypothetical protein
MKGQKGGLRLTNIITKENKHEHIGKVVRVIPLPWMPRDLFDENGFFYVRDTLHNIEPEYLGGELWDNNFPKAGTILDMTEEQEEDHYQWMQTPRNFGVLNVIYRDDRVAPGNELLFRIPLSLKQLSSELNDYESRSENNRLNYLIELITPERELVSKRNIVKRTAQRRQHRLDREAFKELATSRNLRDFPSDMKEYILSSMNVEPRTYNKSTFPGLAPEQEARSKKKKYTKKGKPPRKRKSSKKRKKSL